MPYLCNFGLKILKSFMQKEKSLNLRPKMSFWVFLDLELEKTIKIFGISTLKFAEIQKIVQNKKNKTKKYSDQKCLIRVFWAVSLKKYCPICSILGSVKMQSFVRN